jgi:hypothetical protein
MKREQVNVHRDSGDDLHGFAIDKVLSHMSEQEKEP